MYTNTIFEDGKQHIGFNYWASHAGTNMWRDWDARIVEQDVAGLSDAGATVLRVFPMWRDFQPITMHKKALGEDREVRIKEDLLGFDKIGQAGMDPMMFERFSEFTDICRKYHVKLIVGLLTGWMSGRLLVPEAMEGKNVITDPFCMYWESKFVETFVDYFKENDVIAAWEFGNECNCMADVENQYQAWLWSNTISAAIYRSDSTRPILSGMHSLTPTGEWTMQHQAEVSDILTIHPYPVFTPYCNVDPSTTIKPIIHLAAECAFYRDIGGKKCFTEEIGTTDIRISDENNAHFIRTNLFSALAYDGFPLLWWCGCYEKDLSHSPYSWGHGERGMGLLLPDGKEKNSMNEFRKFKKMCDSFPFQALPERKIQANCILTGEDSWPAALGSFLLSLQSGFNIQYQFHDQQLRKSSFYMLPSYVNTSKEEWEHIMAEVKQGSSIYVSGDASLGTGYNKIFGFEMELMWEQEQEYVYNGQSVKSYFSKELVPTTATVLLRDDFGKPILLKNQYGEGFAYYSPIPIENNYAKQSAVAYTDLGIVYRKIYDTLAKDICKDNIISKKYYLSGITEHWLSENEIVIVLVNYDRVDVVEELKIADGYKIKQFIYGEVAESSNSNVKIKVGRNDGALLILEKSN